MNTNFVLVLASMLASPLHFKDCVVVTKGFYEGCKGIVEQEWTGNPIEYDVKLNCKNETFTARLLGIGELKKCDK